MSHGTAWSQREERGTSLLQQLTAIVSEAESSLTSDGYHLVLASTSTIQSVMAVSGSARWSPATPGLS